MSRILIVGGTGFVGRYIAKTFPKDSVTLVSRSRKVPGYSQIQHDISVSPEIPVDHRVNVVVNCVGIMHEEPSKGISFESAHVNGARNIVSFAEKQNARVVHVSAIGADPSSHAITPYAKTKGISEEIILSYGNSVVLRPSIVFGREDDFFNRFAKLARLLPVVPVFGGGTTRFQPIFVEDLARAVHKCAIDPNIKGVYEIGGPSVYSYRQLMELTLAQAGIRRPILSLPWAIAYMQGFVMDKLPINMFTLTTDQVKMLQKDNVVTPSDRVKTIQDLGIGDLKRAEDVLSQWLR